MKLGGQRGVAKLFSSRSFLIYILTVLAIALLSVLFLLLTHPGGPVQARSEAPPTVDNQDFPYHRILIPEETLELIPGGFAPIREPREYWDQETVDRYWIDPAPIVEELLREENRRLVEDIFESLP